MKNIVNASLQNEDPVRFIGTVFNVGQHFSHLLELKAELADTLALNFVKSFSGLGQSL